MYCRKCGRKIPDDSEFCPYCGEKTTAIPVSNAEVSSRDDENDYGVTVEQQETDPEYEREVQKENARTGKNRDDNINNNVEYYYADKKKPGGKKAFFIFAAFAVAAVAAVVIWMFASGRIGKAAEAVTDASGEKIRQGIGTEEIDVTDADGNIVTVKTDKRLVTKESILKKYTDVMNNLKSDSPGFSVTEYQNLPSKYQHFGSVGGIVLPIIEKYATSKENAKEKNYPAGNSENLPLHSSSYGTLLTDTNKIKTAYSEVMDDGSEKLVIVLIDEENPTALSDGATTTSGTVNAVFEPYDAGQIITEISNLALSNISFNYTNCTAEVVYDPGSEHVKSIKMTMNIDASGEFTVLTVGARIVDITEYTNFIYA